MEIGKEGIGPLENVDKMPTMGDLDMSLLLVPDTFEPLERGPEMVVPVDKDMVRDKEAFIEAMNRAIIDGGFYKNSLEMVKLPPRYNEKTVFQSRFTTEDVRKDFQEEVCKNFYKSGNTD